ncbi:hypothetical protein J3A83DRAFT_4199322 [Scleroderma citrinum]
MVNKSSSLPLKAATSQPSLPTSITKQEVVIYRKLHAHNVPYTATVEASGDVSYKTVTQSLKHKPWSKMKENITGHIHYRLVLKDVGHRLDEFHCTRDLVTAVHDCIRTLVATFRLANIHCSISIGNILILPDEQDSFTKGLLIDWDLSKDVAKLGARRHDQTVSNPDTRVLGASEVWLGNVAIYVCGPP